MLPWLPESLLHLTTPLHLPVGVILSSYLLAHLFAERHRVGVFRDLLAGGLLHLGVDLLQSHLGVGYALLFPFSLWQGEIGWFGSEATVTAAPALVLVTSVLAAWRWGRPRPHTAGGGALRAHPTDGAAWSSR